MLSSPHIKRNNDFSNKQSSRRSPQENDFEKSLARLEEVVKRLESADLSLDEAMK